MSGEFVSELLEAFEAASAGIFASLCDFYSLCFGFRGVDLRAVKLGRVWVVQMVDWLFVRPNRHHRLHPGRYESVG